MHTTGQRSDGDPWHRGIYRPNAQRLSLSLAPLVAQRSLLFRIKADLAGAGPGVQNYDEAEATGKTPLLYSITPNDSTGPISYNDSPFCSDKSNLPDIINDIHVIDDSLVSAFSTVSALSSASVYSQESWRRPNSTTSTPVMNVDPRRHAIVFSPSVQWKDFPSLGSGILNSKDCFDRKRLAVPLYTPQTPSSAKLQLSISTANRKNGDRNPEDRNKEVASDNVVGSIRVFEDPRSVVAIRRRIEGLGNYTTNEIKVSEQRKEEVQTHNSDELRNYECMSMTGVPQTKKTSPSNQDENGETRKLAIKKNLVNSKGFNKVLSRLSMRPFKKGREKEKKTVSVPLLRTFKVPFSDLKPPDLQISPIKVAFGLHPDSSLPPPGTSVNTNEAGPEIGLVHVTLERNTKSIGKHAKSKSISQTPSVSSFSLDVSLSTPSPMRRTLSLRQARPPTLIPPAHSYTKMSTLREASPSTSVCVRPNPGHGHRRTKSSPAVPQFDIHNPPPWEKEETPPLPPMNMANARLQVSNSLLVTMPPFIDQTKKARLRPSRPKHPPGKA